MTNKWLPGALFPDAMPPVRTMEAKYSDGQVDLIVPVATPVRDEQHVILPPTEARALAADLRKRADHIDPPLWDERGEITARTDLQRFVLRRAATELDEPHAHHGDELGHLDDLIRDAARRLVAAAAKGGQS